MQDKIAFADSWSQVDDDDVWSKIRLLRSRVVITRPDGVTLWNHKKQMTYLRSAESQIHFDGFWTLFNINEHVLACSKIHKFKHENKHYFKMKLSYIIILICIQNICTLSHTKLPSSLTHIHTTQLTQLKAWCKLLH